MSSIYSAAAAWTMAREGGWYDGSNPRDPNPTMKGVTQHTYDKYRRDKGLPIRSVRLISDEEWADIAQSYWAETKLYMLADLGLRLCCTTLFDHAFTAGADDGIKILQRALGLQDDGIVGSKTRTAVGQIEQWEDARLADRLNWLRLHHYRDLARSLRLRPNLLSWLNRVADFQEERVQPNL